MGVPWCRSTAGSAASTTARPGPTPPYARVSAASRLIASAGAVAKAVLAFLPDDGKTAVVEGPLSRLTDKTIIDPTVLTHDLDEIKARGYAISREETYPGVYGCGAPVFGRGARSLAPLPSPRHCFAWKRRGCWITLSGSSP